MGVGVEAQGVAISKREDKSGGTIESESPQPGQLRKSVVVCEVVLDKAIRNMMRANRKKWWRCFCCLYCSRCK